VAYESDRPGETPAEQRGAAPHLPSPTIWPVGFAAGVALLLIGLVIGNWPVVAVGAGLSIVFGFLWIRDVTRDVRQAPEPPVAAAPTHELALEDDHVEAEDQTYPKFTRAKLLEGSTLGLGALIGGIITVPVIGFAVAPAFVDQGYDDIDLGPLSEFPEGKWMVTTFRDDKDSPSDVSRRTAYIRNNGFVNSLPSFTIISNRCVHLGCPVQPNGPTDAKKQVTTSTGPVELTPAQPSGFGCPCHGGAYDTEGNRVAGPPVRALDRYRFSVRDGSLWIGNLYSVAKVDGAGGDAVIKGYDNNYDPGVHVDGWEQILYPYNP
jgi:menaquinol-cytochrome c reductase iron-sulfur subunit